MSKILIEVKTLIAPEAHEELEDALRDCLERFGISATIDNLETGYTTQTR